MLGSKVKAGLVILLVFLLSFSIGFGIRDYQSDVSQARLLEQYEHQFEEIETVRNKNVSLDKALGDALASNDDLFAVISELRARPADIEFIIKTETVIKPGQPVFVTPDIPDHHFFELENGLVVAEFHHRESDFLFQTHSLSFKADIVVTDKKTSTLLQMQTSANPSQWVEVPVHTTTTKIKDRKVLEPHIGVGISGSLPKPDVSAAILASFYHPKEELDVGQIRVNVNNHDIRFGIDPVAYNLGSRVPVITDTWISAGPSFGITGWSVDLTIGTKF